MVQCSIQSKRPAFVSKLNHNIIAKSAVQIHSKLWLVKNVTSFGVQLFSTLVKFNFFCSQCGDFCLESLKLITKLTRKKQELLDLLDLLWHMLLVVLLVRFNIRLEFGRSIDTPGPTKLTVFLTNHMTHCRQPACLWCCMPQQCCHTTSQPLPSSLGSRTVSLCSPVYTPPSPAVCHEQPTAAWLAAACLPAGIEPCWPAHNKITVPNLNQM